MKDVTLRITGKQQINDGDSDEMEFLTEGRLQTRGSTLYITYDETELSGMPGCTVQLAVKGDSVRMRRRGEPLSEGKEIRFEKDKRYTGVFDTPYGSVRMEVLTTRVDNRIGPENKGTLAIDYDISLQGLTEGHSRLELEII